MGFNVKKDEDDKVFMGDLDIESIAKELNEDGV